MAAFGRVPLSPGSIPSAGAPTSVAVGVVTPVHGGAAPLLLGPQMRPRDETIFWLSLAAEIEHSLMVQYLFAAYSIDPASVPAENDVRRLATEIRNTLLQIAREEMGHFISVQNLLHAVGGALHFGRQFSPFEFAIQPFSYRLEPATLDSIAKYVIAESPNRPVSELVLRPDPAQDAAIKQKLIDDIGPRAVRSNGGIPLFHVGELFARLHDLFKSGLDDTDLRPGRGGFQATWRDWGYEALPGTGGKIVLVEELSAASASDLRRDAVTAIAAIGDQGEAFDAPVADGDESHFERFLSLYEKLEQAETALGRPIALPVVMNPATIPPPAPGGHITHGRALRWAHLCNLRYRLLLDCLHHSLLSDLASYEVSGTQMGDRTPKGILQLWTFAEMRRFKVIAEKLVELPAGTAPGSRAGPPFELPYSLRMPHIEADRWAMHADVFAAAAEFISQEMLVDGETGANFLEIIAEADRTAARIATTLARGEPLPSGTHATDFAKTTRILDESVRGFAFRSPHAAFWRDSTQAEMIDSGRVVPGDPEGSNLLNRIALDQAEAGGMPKERPRIAPERVEYVRDWIARGAPDNDPTGMIGLAGEPVPPREPAAT
ncbi:ferritin-like domain-containing protein [Mesorhizobium sp.]|uniref:ferritin-like domain-containing protein n=1 Tax=Mesorhizobium sp. TaxID=1871066 RepID=UPI00257DD632|nr:ferritin-like domain-containing protein [Mesorhizobium sp.]